MVRDCADYGRTCPLTQGMTPINPRTTQVRRHYDSQRHELVLVMRPARPAPERYPVDLPMTGTGGDILLQRTPVG